MSQKKLEWVTVPKPSQWNPNDHYPTPEGHEGEYTRLGVRSPWQKNVEESVHVDGLSLNELVVLFEDVAARLEVNSRDDLRISVETEQYPYDDAYTSVVRLYGTRPAKLAEVETIKEFQKWQLKRDADWTERRKQLLIEEAKRLGLNLS